MKKTWLSAAAAVVLLVQSSPAERQSPFTNQSRPMLAQVTMLAVSSSSRQSFAGNQEVYLADLQTKNGEHQFVRLVDQYPGYGLPIRDSLLRSRTLFTMRVTREPECDVPGSQIFLAPSDAVVFNASARDSLQAQGTELVPCYKTLHSTIRIAKVK
ncbi:hypothetical protein [Terriglobus aquaticus]|uniref:Uncharacterized protein n=1 Tax=Terriglobus aquaticus TaxID=940139 RepID=A0ABW9KI84_9BACT|nr:hypothetical protein [Terriglobus aquaticus]